MLLVEGFAMDGMLRTLLHQYWHLQKVTDTQSFWVDTFIGLEAILSILLMSRFFPIVRSGVRAPSQRIPVLLACCLFLKLVQGFKSMDYCQCAIVCWRNSLKISWRLSASRVTQFDARVNTRTF